MSSGSAGRSQVVDVSYDDHRTGNRVWERRVQEVPYEEIQRIEGQELALYRPPETRAREDRRDERGYYGGRAYDDYYAGRPRPGEQVVARRDDRYEDRYEDRHARQSTDRHRDRRRDEYKDRRRRDYSESDSESSREPRRERRHRRAKSERASKRDEEEDDGGRLWYSGKPRREGNFRERHFDSSYDGLIAAAAGAAIGAITAREFGGHENRKWKIAGSAAVGAAGFNVAENHYRVWTEERGQKRENEGKSRKDQSDPGLDAPLQLGGALVAQGGP